MRWGGGGSAAPCFCRTADLGITAPLGRYRRFRHLTYGLVRLRVEERRFLHQICASYGRSGITAPGGAIAVFAQLLHRL